MRIIYEAEDGKQFDNECDCRIYEDNVLADKLLAKATSLEMYDKYMKPTKIAGETFYVVMKTQADYDYFKHLSDIDGTSYPKDLGSWYYDDNMYHGHYDEWFEWNKED